MTEYVVNNRTGEVHESDCPRVKVIRSTSPWDPAKAALTPGVYADRICLSGNLPLRQPVRITWHDELVEQQMAWLRDQFCDCPGRGMVDSDHAPGCHGLAVVDAVRHMPTFGQFETDWRRGTGHA